jgi:hypothetical protein
MTDKKQVKPKATKNKLKRKKYNNKKVMYNGYQFDSVLEAERYVILQSKEQAHEVRNLRRQVPYRFEYNNRHITSYIADFVYEEYDAGADVWRLVVEDVKGVRTPVYNLKKRMMLVWYDVTVREWPVPGDVRLKKDYLKNLLSIKEG